MPITVSTGCDTKEFGMGPGPGDRGLGWQMTLVPERSLLGRLRCVADAERRTREESRVRGCPCMLQPRVFVRPGPVEPQLLVCLSV